MRKYSKLHILIEETGGCLSIDLSTNKVENWLFGRSIRTSYKTSDRCIIKFEKQEIKELLHYSGYVPDFFPGKHYGDYLELSISKDGNVNDFNVTDDDIDKLLKEAYNYDNEDEDDDD